MAERVRVLIVDDHASFAESLRDVLGRREGIEVVGIAGNVAEAVRLAAEAKPKVVLMDQRLPDGSGAMAAGRLLDSDHSVAVVMLTGGGSEDEMLDAVEAGVCGYLIKTARVADIATAIERAATGEMLIPAATLTQLMRHARERARERQDRARLRASLTDRERDVLRAMASGDDTALMAETLKISRHTTRGYVQTIIEKLGAHSRLEAVLRAQQLGLLED